MSLALSPHPALQRQKLTRICHQLYLALPQLPDETAVAKVKEAARAPYGITLPTVLGSGIIGPPGWTGDQILALLRSGIGSSATLDVAPLAGATGAAFEAALGDALVSWLLSADVLTSLKPEELALARSSSERGTYLKALSAFLAEPEQAQWQTLVATLSRYLQDAAQAVFDSRRRGGEFGSDVADEKTVVIKGTTTITLEVPDDVVSLRGVPDEKPEAKEPLLIEVEPMSLLAKTVPLPDPLTPAA